MNRLRLHIAALFLVLVPAITCAQDKFFNSDGVNIRYVEQGSGEPVVMLHGSGGSLDTWINRGILQNLAKNYRVIAFDARGHGKSGKPHDPNQYGREMALDTVRLLDHLGIQRAHVVGYSMGANLTSQLLTLRSDHFLSAILVAGAGRFDWNTEEKKIAETEASERERECISRTQTYRLAPVGEPKPSEQEIKALSEACFADPNQDRFAMAALTRSRGDQLIERMQAAAVKVPTLGIVGTLDPNKVGLEALKKLRPNLELIIVDGATHGGERGILRRPELIAAIREFIGGKRPPR